MKKIENIEAFPTVRYAAEHNNGYTSKGDPYAAATIPANGPGSKAWNRWKIRHTPRLALVDNRRTIVLEDRTKGEILDDLLSQHWTKDVLGGALVALRELGILRAGSDELPDDLARHVRARELALRD